MAITFVGSDISTASSTDADTLSVPIPAHTAGDLIIVICKGEFRPASITWGTPSGWTALPLATKVYAPQTDRTLEVQGFWRIGDGSVSSVSITASSGASSIARSRHVSLVFSGFLGTPTFALQTETQTAPSLPTGPSNGTATRDSLAIACAVSSSSVGSGGGYDNLNSFTHRSPDPWGSQSPRARAASNLVTAGSIVWPTYASGTSNDWIYYQLVVADAAGGIYVDGAVHLA